MKSEINILEEDVPPEVINKVNSVLNRVLLNFPNIQIINKIFTVTGENIYNFHVNYSLEINGLVQKNNLKFTFSERNLLF